MAEKQEPKVKRVQVRLTVEGHTHQGVERPRDEAIEVTEQQAQRLIDAKRGEPA